MKASEFVPEIEKKAKELNELHDRIWAEYEAAGRRVERFNENAEEDLTDEQGDALEKLEREEELLLSLSDCVSDCINDLEGEAAAIKEEAEGLS